MLIKLNDCCHIDHSLVSCVRIGGAFDPDDGFFAYSFDGGGIFIGYDPKDAERVADEVNKWREMEMQKGNNDGE